MDSRRRDDLEKLNALVDGEMAPNERAAIAARLAVERDLASAHATLARLKAAATEMAEDCPPIILRRPRWLAARRLAAAIAACIALVVAGALLVREARQADKWPIAGTPEGPMQVTMASLPAGTTIPRLDVAGLKLVNLAFNPGHVPLFTATYLGPHGCRLDLNGWPVGADGPSLSGTSMHRWVAGDLVYELTAHGMPKWRFQLIAGGAEQQTRLGSDPGSVQNRLREADRGAPPCLG
jgi:hypothetical protein